MITAMLVSAILAAGPTDTAAVLQHAREAIRLKSLEAHPEGLMLRGKSKVMGEEADYSLVFNPQGQFALEITGRLPRTLAFNGKTAWEIDFQGTPRVLELDDRAQALLSIWFSTGQWLLPAAAIHFADQAAADGDAATTLTFDLDEGRITGTVRLSTATWLPEKFTWGTKARTETMTPTGYAEQTGFLLPARLEDSVHGAQDVYTLASAAPAPAFFRSPYEPRLTIAPATFDAAASNQLEVRKAPTGHLLVRPKLAGVESGYFIFDTGAGSTVIDPAAAKAAGLDPFGAVPVVGVGGPTTGSFYQASSLTLGPVTIDKPIMVGSDLSFLKQYMGVEIAGVVGFDLLARCISQIDLADSRISIENPAAYKLPRGQWTDLVLYGKHPCVRGSFEGHNGIFNLDTGAGNATVTMHAPAVEKFKLLEGRQTTPAQLGGVGGMVAAQAGTLTSLDLGGKHFENIQVTFATEAKGAFGDPYTVGNIGGGILGKFTLVLDYGQRRIAFLEREETPAK